MSGSGTLDDPYVIGRWEISAFRTTGIRVIGTTSHLVIRDVYVRNGLRTPFEYADGILFRNVQNGRIEASTITNTTTAVRVISSPGTVIAQNNLVGNERGVWIVQSSDNLVENNIVNHNLDVAITVGGVMTFEGEVFFGPSSGTQVRNNRVSFNYYGIGIGFDRLTVIEGNTVTDSVIGMNLVADDDSLIQNNTVTRNIGGMIIQDCLNLTVRDNRIFEGREGMEIIFGRNYTLTGNELRNNTGFGIYLAITSNHTILGNVIDGTPTAIWVQRAIYTKIVGNRLTNDQVGIFLCNEPFGNQFAPPVNDFTGTKYPMRHCNRTQPYPPGDGGGKTPV